FHQEELERPKRVFFDLKGVRAIAALQDVTLKFDDDVVREIRLGRHPQTTTRVVLDLTGVDAYSVYSLYNPYRLIIDFRRTAGINEAELTLDVALRLQKLLLKQPGMEVVMTRDTDIFIPLQERTAIANREGADLFLSIHANASRNPKARGIESYFLNFATNPE